MKARPSHSTVASAYLCTHLPTPYPIFQTQKHLSSSAFSSSFSNENNNHVTLWSTYCVQALFQALDQQIPRGVRELPLLGKEPLSNLPKATQLQSLHAHCVSLKQICVLCYLFRYRLHQNPAHYQSLGIFYLKSLLKIIKS